MNEIPTAATPGFARLARTGKIARLPAALRQQINQRLEDGVQARPIVDWLNNLPEVQVILKEQFEGRLIREQNVSDWRKGGYRDWLSHQETVEMHERISVDTEELQAKGSLSEKLAAWLLSKYLVAARAVTNEDGTVDLKRLRDLSRDVATLRRGEIWAERLKLERERFAYQQVKDDRDLKKMFWAWAMDDENREKICEGFTTRKELIQRAGQMLFGELWMSREELVAEQEAAAKEAVDLLEKAEQAAALYRAEHPEQSGLIRPTPGAKRKKKAKHPTSNNEHPTTKGEQGPTSKTQTPNTKEASSANLQTASQSQAEAAPVAGQAVVAPVKAKIQPPIQANPGQSGLIRATPGGPGLIVLPPMQHPTTNIQPPTSRETPMKMQTPIIKPATPIGPKHSNGGAGGSSGVPLGGQTHTPGSSNGSIPLGGGLN